MELNNPEQAKMSFDNLLITSQYEKELVPVKSFEHISKAVKYFTDVILREEKHKANGSLLDVNDFAVKCAKTGKIKGYVINILIRE